ncbi:D-glycero-beta-D-manno-heptose 1,7-bisphosphate 7-phosphatase [Agaribacter flavus]|uniref:D,D-heptose 1,7-bisphosphate phosphatase n=1 Tax=Agaribacter flavus TaxID=1902781 RepID=A0ABV7FIK3_9ALTE
MKNKALFLDRDGVINVNHGYVYQQQNFDWVDGIFTLIKRANRANYKVIVVTNQSGIGRGFYSELQFLALSDWMRHKVANKGGVIDDVFYCPHHPTESLGEYKLNCDCRKPKPGMLFAASQKHDIDLSMSIMIGDKLSDIKAAEAANLATAYLFKGGKVNANATNHPDRHFQSLSIQSFEQVSFP